METLAPILIIAGMIAGIIFLFILAGILMVIGLDGLNDRYRR